MEAWTTVGWAVAGAFVASAFGTWLSGLLVVRAPADALLPLRIQRYRVRCGLLVGGLPVVALLLVDRRTELPIDGPVWIPCLLALLVVSSLGAVVGGTPVARVHFDDRVGVLRRVRQSLRWTAAFFGFWLLMVATPFLVDAAPRAWAWPVAAPLAIALILWGENNAALVRRFLGARPIADPLLRARFEEIWSRSNAPRPVLAEFAERDGAFTNAFAVPSLRQPLVLLSRPLLRRLPAEQSAAIFAHEVAHLEDFDRRTLRRWRIEGWVFSLAGAFGVPIGALVSKGAVTTLLWSWFFVLLVWMIRRARRSQERETYSDRRGAELCGDAEALVQGLIALHEANYLPRRMAADVEGKSSHPSLARRIRALRGGADDAAPADPAEDVHESFAARRGRWKSLHVATDGLRLEGKEELHLPVESLVQMSVRSRAFGPALDLLGVDGEAHRFLVRGEDVGRLQAALDAIDARLAPLPKRSGFFDVRLLVSLVVLGSMLLALLADAAGVLLYVALTALASSLRRTRTGVLSLAAMSLLLALHGLATRAAWSSGLLALTLGVAAAGALLLRAGLRERALRPGRLRRTVLVHGSLLLVALLPAPFVLAESDLALALFGLARHGPLLLMPLVALGGALLGSRARAAGLAALLAAALLLACGSAWFLETFTDDDFAPRPPRVSWTKAEYRALFSFDVEEPIESVRIAPDGKHLLALGFGDGLVPILVCDRRGHVVRHEGAVAAFAGSDTILLLHGLELRQVPLDAPESVLWRRTLPAWVAEHAADLAVRGAVWSVTSRRDRRWTYRCRGRVGTDELERDEWVAPGRGASGRALGPASSAVEAYARPGRPPGVAFARLLQDWFDGFVSTTNIRAVLNGEARHLATTALPVELLEPSNSGPVLGLVAGRRPASVWLYDFGTPRFRPGVSLDLGYAWRWDGGRLTVLGPDHLASVLVERGAGTRWELPGFAEGATLLAAEGPWIAIGWPGEGARTHLELLALP